MKFINTDGMAFIGPGSEWFWTALQFTALAITFYAIYRQLRTQAHAGAIEQVESLVRESNSEEMNRYELEVLVALRDRKDPADLPGAAAFRMGAFWGKFAILARAGHRDVKLLWRTDPSSVQVRWAWIAPYVRKLRAESGRREVLEDFEWLAGVMADMDRRAGREAITSAWIASRIDLAISFRQALIRSAQAMRTVILAPPEAMSVAQPTVAAPPT